MTPPIDSRLCAELVRLLFELGFDTAERCERLFSTDELKRLSAAIPQSNRPDERLRSIIGTFADRSLPDGRRLLIDLLDAAIHDSVPTRPQTARLRALVDQLDARRRATWGLTRRHHGHEIRSTELTVKLDRVTTAEGERIRVEYLAGGQPVSIPVAHYSAADAAEPDEADLLWLLFPRESPTGEHLDPLAEAIGHPTLLSTVRLRICTEDAALRRLPWTRVRNGNAPMARGDVPWTIELTPNPRPEAHIELPRVPRVIVVAEDPGWAASVRSMLDTYGANRHRADNRVIPVPDPERLPERLGIRRHPIVLAFGLDAEGLARLRAAMQKADCKHQPAAVCVVDPPPDHLLGVLLSGTAVEVHAPSRDQAHIWLRAVILQATDPVTAAHSPTLDAPLPVAADFARWTPSQASIEKLPLPALVLDRIHQRRQVKDQLESLVARGGRHQVEAFVAVGPPENRLDELAEQIDEHIADKLGDLDFDRRQIRLRRVSVTGGGPREIPSMGDLKRALWSDVRTALDPEGTVEPHDKPGLLAALARQKLPGVDRVVWLEWGTFGHDAAHPPLTDEELHAWLAWHESLAGQHWPDDLRIASFLALEEPDARRREAIAKTVKGTNITRKLDVVRYTALPPVGKVEPDELREYLDKEELCRIHSTYAQRLTAALYTKTDGDFVRLVELIERAWLIGPDELLDELE